MKRTRRFTIECLARRDYAARHGAAGASALTCQGYRTPNWNQFAAQENYNDAFDPDRFGEADGLWAAVRGVG
jgi:hypothetical protein